MQKMLVILGPTASGKSALGVEVARAIGGEIVSADSRQVYRGLDRGTGKITKKEMRGIPHHLLNVVSPKKRFSASDFTMRARAAIADISKRGKLPIIVGGTGFYIDALAGRISLPDIAPNARLRTTLNKKTVVELFEMLSKMDPNRAQSMDTPSERNNKIRLIRAIEIARALGASPSRHARVEYDVLWIGIAPKDVELKKRIRDRLRQRIRAGMVKEAVRLHTAGLSYKRMRELGLEYRSLARYLQGEITLPEMEKELQSDIWRYARKQIGYWKRNKEIRWFDPKSKKVLPTVKAWLRK